MSSKKRKRNVHRAIQLSRTDEKITHKPAVRLVTTQKTERRTGVGKLASGLWLVVSFLVLGVLFLEPGQTLRSQQHSTVSNLASLFSKVAPIHTQKLGAKTASTLVLGASRQRPKAGKCSGATIMNVVAHEDDDLLFINPTITHAITTGVCVRTVYLTAGDDGRSVQYLHLRESGSEAAYNAMLGSTKPWNSQQVTLSSGETVTVDSPEGNDAISLIFLRLPDGNLDGSGFAATGYESLAKLEKDASFSAQTVDGQNTYTGPQLTDTLVGLMRLYQPTHLNTQANDSTEAIADHSDHIATGQFAATAIQTYLADAGKRFNSKFISYYMGYPIRGLPSNLNSTDLQQKAAAFFAYAADDPGVCTSLAECTETSSTYGEYLSRQYTQSQ